MNRKMWVVAFVVVAFTGATLAAQTSGTPSSQSSSGTITLTGCLQKGSASGGTTGTSGTGATSGTGSSSSSSGGQFVLTNAQMGSGSSSRSTSGTSGAGSPSSSASSGSRYILDGQESELTKHVGEKVEITGTLASGSSSSSGTSSSATSGTSTSSMPSSSGQHVKVQSVTTVASSCSQ